MALVEAIIRCTGDCHDDWFCPLKSVKDPLTAENEDRKASFIHGKGVISNAE